MLVNTTSLATQEGKEEEGKNERGRERERERETHVHMSREREKGRKVHFRHTFDLFWGNSRTQFSAQILSTNVPSVHVQSLPFNLGSSVAKCLLVPAVHSLSHFEYTHQFFSIGSTCSYCKRISLTTVRLYQ